MTNKTDKLINAVNEFKKLGDETSIAIHGKQYFPVAPRIGTLRRVLGSSLSITTEIISIDKETVVVKATGSIDGKVLATGHAEEKRTASRINQTSALENAETSSIGRMCSFLGITNDQIASSEEISAALEQQDKKIQKALDELNLISHAGSFNQWLSNYKTFLGTLKEKSPIIYASFMERYSAIKTNLKQKGVIK
jgi:hypothetical protein|tara:strand:- start:11 stop:595 length:585 start_codon:yes stop_codon:yes gene_type:complete